jgi:hypothetical protein
MIKRMLSTVVVASLVLGGAAYAYAQAQPDDPRAAGDAPEAAPGPRARCRAVLGGDDGARAQGARARRFCRHHALLARTVHGDLVVRTRDGFANLTYDRGEVTSVSAEEITLRRPDGPSVTLALADDTRYIGVGGPDEIRTGEQAAVLAREGTAVAVAQRPGNYSPGSGVDGIGDQVPAA